MLTSFSAAAIKITAISPAVGTVGTLVTINGTDLNNLTTFSIGGAPAIVISNSGTKLVGMVMPGAVSGKISVTNSTGTTESQQNFYVVVATPPDKQQGNKLVGAGSVGPSFQGQAVALSADGNTAVIGGFIDNNEVGAVWIFVRDNGIWQQQGNKLVGRDMVGQADFGSSVAISADGNTAAIGGWSDDSNTGAVWIFVRNGNSWSQQGNKLLFEQQNALGQAFGEWVSLSADGNTLVAELAGDLKSRGSAVIFVRNGDSWTQQGGKLVADGTGSPSPYLIGAQQVAISADGTTIVMGATESNGHAGGWVFTRTDGVWKQQGGELPVTGYVGDYGFASVAINADGNTIAMGLLRDNNETGAAWIFTRQNGIWTQQGEKLVGSNSVLPPELQGYAVSLSADGNILYMGGPAGGAGVNESIGSTWIFTRQENTWTEQSKIQVAGGIYKLLQGQAVALSADGRTGMVGGSGDNYNTGAAWIFATSDFPTLSILVTKPATTVTTNSAFLNGTADGNGNLTTVVFEYSTLPDLSNSTILNIGSGITTVSGGSGVNNFSNILTGLTPATTYYFRIVGVTTVGQSVGEILSFTTPATKPTGSTTDVKIPTAFTPNNDGINDKWDLPVLDSYPGCVVKVFNRYGQLVYSCNGIYKAWDGRTNNKDVPSGTYYYTIKFDAATTPVSGSLLLIR